MESKDLERDIRLSVAEGGLATVMGTLFSGVFLTGFACSLDASRLQIGILFALPALCGVAQLAGSYLIERWSHVRRLCLVATLASRLLFVPVIFVPLLFSQWSPNERVWVIVVLLLLSHLLGSIGGVAWLTWIKALIPAGMRVSFFGRRHRMNVALAFTISLGGGFLVDLWGDSAEQRIVGFSVVFAIAMLCGMVSSALLSFVSDGTYTPAINTPTNGHGMFSAPLAEPNFRRMVLFYTTWTLAVNVAAPFIPVFFMQKLGLPFWYVIVLNSLSSIMGLAANNFWTRLGQRFGMKPIVMVASVGEALFPLALMFVGPETSWLLLLVHLTGVFNTPVAIGPDNLVLKLAPDHRASSYMAVFRSFVGPATALAAIIGGYLAERWSGSDIAVGSLQMGGLKLVFLLSFVGRIASLMLLRGVCEPEAQSLQYVARVLQRSRYWRRPAVVLEPLPPPVVPSVDATSA